MTDFLKEYIKHKSPSGQEKNVQLDFTKPFLEKEMKWSEIEIIDNSEEKNRPNINARLEGEGDGKNLLFNGHADVVDVPKDREKAWDFDPWEPSVKNNKIYGRGANDMKGSNTAMIWAIKAIMESNISLKGDILLSLVVGEESAEQEIGVIAAVKSFLDKGIEIPFCINGEPTNNEIHTKSAGTFDFRINIQGKEVHTCQKNLINYPQRFDIPDGKEIGVDAIPIMIKVLEKLEELEHLWNMRYKDKIYGGGGYPGPDVQGVGPISICSTLVNAGEYISSIAGEAEIKGQIYYPPSVDENKLWKEVKEAIESLSKTNDWLKENAIEMEWKESFQWPPFEVEPDHPGCHSLGRAVKEITGQDPVYSGFKAVADNAFIQKECNIDTISFGAGDLSMGSHGPNEYIPIEQLMEAAKIYAAMITEWCN